MMLSSSRLRPGVRAHVRSLLRVSPSTTRLNHSENRFNSIVSPRFCDVVLERLAPTFDPNVPIDIIDMFPNSPLWSSKFHEMLKPRRHLLIESHRRRSSRLQELVDQPGATYSLLRFDPSDSEAVFKVFDRGLLPEQEADAKTRPPHAPNPNLLVLFNNARVKIPPHVGNSVFAKHLQSFIDGSYCSRYGPVRMIAVVPTDYAESVLPKAVALRRRISGLAEGVARIYSVARNDSYASKIHLKGLKGIEQSQHRVSERMKESGITFPPGREPELSTELAPVPRYERITHSPIEYCPRPRLAWHDEYIKSDAMYTGSSFFDRTSPRYKRYVRNRRELLYENRQAGIVDKVVEIHMKIDAIDEKLRQLKAEHGGENLSGLELITVLRELVNSRSKLAEEAAELTSRLGMQPRRVLDGNLDEMRGFEVNEDGKREPILQWDRRPYEPLKTLPEDFSLRRMPCAVLDIHPDPSAPVSQAQNKLRAQGKHEDCEAITQAWFHLCRLLFSRGKESVSKILKTLFTTAPITDLVQAIPALQQRAVLSVSFDKNEKGGPVARIHYKDDCLDSCVYRTVPTGTLWAIAAYWHEWPFKPVSTENLHKILGGGTFSEPDYNEQ